MGKNNVLLAAWKIASFTPSAVAKSALSYSGSDRYFYDGGNYSFFAPNTAYTIKGFSLSCPYGYDILSPLNFYLDAVSASPSFTRTLLEMPVSKLNTWYPIDLTLSDTGDGYGLFCGIDDHSGVWDAGYVASTEFQAGYSTADCYISVTLSVELNSPLTH
jgi:hypothetical protein